MGSDFWLVFRWWGTLFLIGAAAFPFTKLLFRNWYDEGYLFAKALGLASVTWIVYVLGTVRLLPFTNVSVIVSLILLFAFGIVLNLKTSNDHAQSRQISKLKTTVQNTKRVKIVHWRTILVEELFFFSALLFWSWVKGHEPSIRGLEKFMDFGFMQSALTGRYFPPADMWYAGSSINYYYFGHLATALLSKLSDVSLQFGFNIMLATIFACTLTMSFSISYQLLRTTLTHVYTTGRRILMLAGSALSAYIVTLGGNLQTIYAFTQGYSGEDVKPFWELLWPISEFWQKLPEGLNRYWYANATRFIPFSIHEFPSYSFVVSDVHGHVLSLPFTLLTIALLYEMFSNRAHQTEGARDSVMLAPLSILFYGFLVGVLLMTNALDGPIYLLLFLVLLVTTKFKFPFDLAQDRPFDSSQGRRISNPKRWQRIVLVFGLVAIVSIIVSIPFLSHFKSFVTGLAVNCPIEAIANSRIGPIIFETVDKCQRSPLWMLLVLWGFFLVCGAWLKGRDKGSGAGHVLRIFFFFSLALIIFPEFFYFKDIYPAHFRSNTMFKLGYQAFILFAIVSGFQITRMAVHRGARSIRVIFFLMIAPLLFLVSIYPIFSVRSYFNKLKTYEGIDGIAWLRRDYPDDYAAIEWLQNETGDTRQETGEKKLVLVEADGDSYTDYARFSVFTGYPTIIGWAVHEWLWRGTYDVVAPRREEVRMIYESIDLEGTRRILQKYRVSYIVVGTLERERYTALREAKFNALGQIVYRSGATVLYRVR